MARIVKRCPDCGEVVAATATRCRYCRHRFRSWTLQVSAAALACAAVIALALW